MIKKIRNFIVSICIMIASFSLLSACGANEYAITKEDANLGSYTVTAEDKEIHSSKGGIVVSINLSPDSGCEAISVIVTAGETEVKVMKSGVNRYSFTMPESDVQITAVFQYIPDKYAPDNSIIAQKGYQSAELLLYRDGTFRYTYATNGMTNGATLVTKMVYTGSFEQKGDIVTLSASEREFTYSFSHPRADVAKAAFEQFAEEHKNEITSTLDKANTAYAVGTCNDVFEFVINEGVNSFGVKTA